MNDRFIPAKSSHSGNPERPKRTSSNQKSTRKAFRDSERIQEVKHEPHLHNATRKLLEDIGKPKPSPFIPDPFQTEALNKLSHTDVLVSAPTGSGKTWIAIEATKDFLSRKMGIWYATPLKALSNSKYEEFGQAFGIDNVGILTGDRKENADAPVIVGTTEILRNQLYDAMNSGLNLNIDLVILDEAHYLGDIDRGVVWEELLIYLPRRVRILLLSATISNADNVSHWLSTIRKKKCSVVQSNIRPVPLHILFRSPKAELTPFLKGDKLFPKVADFIKPERKTNKFRINTPHVNDIMETLREFNLLPAIFFLKSRADCDRAVESLDPSPTKATSGGFSDFVQTYLEPYPELRTQKQLKSLLATRAASHHAGQLPGWKLLIEKAMIDGHLEAIFSTSTVAAGVNFPARTVVLLQSDRFNGRSFSDMTATDLHQMIGRAGRRGMDKAGFALVIPGRHLKIPLIRELLLSDPEPLQSKIAVNFSMVLNLLLSHTPEGVQNILGYSFAAFSQSYKLAKKTNTKLIRDFHHHLSLLQELRYVDMDGVPTYDGKWAAQLRLDHPILIAELIRNKQFHNLSPEELAGLIAPFVTDKDKDISISKEAWERSRHLWTKFKDMVQNLKPVAQFMMERGFDVPSIMFWPSIAAYLWTQQYSWEELADNIGADEGDLAMLLLRTADHLRQLTSLYDSQPDLAKTARIAVEQIMRIPLL